MSPRRVTVAVPTYRRPRELARAVLAVAAQTSQVNAAGAWRCDILVVDNDADASARATADAHAVRYVVEPRPGIAAVRNRALAECADADAIVFLDDDEIPAEGWLEQLLLVFERTGADAVAGKVETTFPPTADDWVRASGAFVRPRRTDGQCMPEAATNNLLLDVRRVREVGIGFDERFGLTGGSDSMFTRELTRRGGVIRWAEHALVVEQEESERFTRRWVLMRTFRFGNTGARVEIALADAPGRRAAARVRTLGRGAARVLAGSGRVALGVVSGSLHHRARGARTAYRGAGMIAGAVGYAHDEYGRRRRR